MTPRRIEVEIDSIAFEGRGSAHRDLVAAAIHRGLVRMAAPGGALSASPAALEGAIEGAVSRALGGAPGEPGRPGKGQTGRASGE